MTDDEAIQSNRAIPIGERGYQHEQNHCTLRNKYHLNSSISTINQCGNPSLYTPKFILSKFQRSLQVSGLTGAEPPL